MVAKVVTSIADLRALARRRLPRTIFEFVDCGSYDEITLRRNRADLDALQFRQRVISGVSHPSVATTVLGESWAQPVAIAPTGLAGFVHLNGEISGARAAEKAGVPFTLSTMSVCSIEEVREAVSRPFWFQVYLMRDRGFSKELIERARAAQCSALVLTLDLTVQGTRRRDIKNGLSIPPRLTLRSALEIASRPHWALDMLRGKRRTFGNFEGSTQRTGSLRTLSQWIASQFDASLTWRDVDWVRALWPGKLIVKGILDAEDARLAAAAGVDAIVVSNHGGRQLDSAPSSISVLPEIAEALVGPCELLFDGGVQSGQDVLKALARGARACLIGKTFLYALAAGGEAEVSRALAILRSEFEVSMTFCGVSDARRVDRSVLRYG